MSLSSNFAFLTPNPQSFFKCNRLRPDSAFRVAPASGSASISISAWRCCTTPTVAATPNIAKTSITSIAESESPLRRQRHYRLKYSATPDARPVTEVQRGEALMGTVCDVGPANSAWLEVNVSSCRGRSVRARLRLDHSAVKKRGVDSIKEGTILLVHVHTVYPASGRMEVRLGSTNRMAGALIDGNNNDNEDEAILNNRKPVKDLQVGECIQDACIMAVGSYGAVVDVGVYRNAKKNRPRPFFGLLQRKHFPETWGTAVDAVRRSDTTRLLEVGDAVPVWIRAVHPDTPRLLLDAVAVDIEKIEQETAEKKRNQRKAVRRGKVNNVSVGEVRRGIVREVAKFGLFVDIGLRKDALIHYTEIGDRFSTSWKTELPVGTKVDLEIMEVEAGDENKKNMKKSKKKSKQFRQKQQTKLNARLVTAPLIDIEIAREIAARPGATMQDVQKLQLLEEQMQNMTGALGELVLSVNGQTLVAEEQDQDQDGNNNKVKDANNASSETESIGSSGRAAVIEMNDASDGEDDEEEKDDDEDDVEDDAENDDIEQFSDDYFEDKYGY